MTKEIIGQVLTDENGKARMSLDISDINQDITEDFTLGALYDEFDDSIDFTNITYTLTLDAEETQIDTGDPLIISGELTSSDGSIITDETINIYSNGRKIKTIIVEDGEYEDTISNLGDGGYTIYAGWRNDHVISENINVIVGEPELTLTAEKQYLNLNVESNSLILTGFYGAGTTPIPGEEVKIYDGSTLIDTKTTNTNGGFEVPLSNMSQGMHLYKATCGEIESEIFEVYIGYGNEVVIETTSDTITFGYTEDYPWMNTGEEDVTIDFGDGETEIVSDPVSILTHTFDDNKEKHMIVLFSSDYAIVTLGYDFLRGNTGVTSIIIGGNPSAILDGAFYGCTGLQSINIPYNIEEIGESAFEGCTSLQKVIIGDEVTDIGNKAFYGCTSVNDYKLFWRGTENIISYDSNIFQTNLLTNFIVPSGEKNNYITKGYPSNRVEEGGIDLTITADKQEYNMDEDVIVTITLKESGEPIPWEDIEVTYNSDILEDSFTQTLKTNGYGQVIKNLKNLGYNPPLTCGGDIDIIATYGNISDVLNIDGHIYKNSLQEEDESNWILLGDLTISYDTNGVELLGNGEGALISKKQLLKYNHPIHSITIEYDLIYGGGGYSYINMFFNTNTEGSMFQLAKKPYGTKGTILDEYPNTDNWINKVIENNDHVEIRIFNGYRAELYVNDHLFLRKNMSADYFKGKFFSFATVQNSHAIYKNLKIEFEEDFIIDLSTDKSVIESGETATITAAIGEPNIKPNKKLHYQVKNGTTLMYEGDVITDEYGEATITYTGTGVGDVDIIFTYFDIEETIRIEDGAGKTQTIITLTSPTQGGTYFTDETINIEGILVDKDGEPLANKQIKIENSEVE